MKRLLTVICATVAMLAFGTAVAEECVEVDLRAEKIEDNPLDALDVFFAIANCGTQTGLADVSVSLAKDEELVGEIKFNLALPAELDFSRQWQLPIPPAVPAGSYRLCVGVELGSGSDSACATVEIDAEGNVLTFAPEVVTAVQRKDWGSVKNGYRP